MTSEVDAVRQPTECVPRPEWDLRALSAPAPLLRSLELADALSPGETATVLTPCWPEPLFTALAERGLRWHADAVADGGARVCLWRPDAGA